MWYKHFLDGIFVDNPDTNNYYQYNQIDWRRIGFDATQPDANSDDRSRAGLAYTQIQNLFGSRRFAGLNGGLTRNMYPVEVLLAVSTIYLDASCNTTDLLGITFKQATAAADEVIKRLYSPII